MSTYFDLFVHQMGSMKHKQQQVNKITTNIGVAFSTYTCAEQRGHGMCTRTEAELSPYLEVIRS